MICPACRRARFLCKRHWLDFRAWLMMEGLWVVWRWGTKQDRRRVYIRWRRSCRAVPKGRA